MLTASPENRSFTQTTSRSSRHFLGSSAKHRPVRRGAQCDAVPRSVPERNGADWADRSQLSREPRTQTTSHSTHCTQRLLPLQLDRLEYTQTDLDLASSNLPSADVSGQRCELSDLQRCFRGACWPRAEALFLTEFVFPKRGNTHRQPWRNSATPFTGKAQLLKYVLGMLGNYLSELVSSL